MFDVFNHYIQLISSIPSIISQYDAILYWLVGFKYLISDYSDSIAHHIFALVHTELFIHNIYSLYAVGRSGAVGLCSVVIALPSMSKPASGVLHVLQRSLYPIIHTRIESFVQQSPCFVDTGVRAAPLRDLVNTLTSTSCCALYVLLAYMLTSSVISRRFNVVCTFP